MAITHGHDHPPWRRSVRAPKQKKHSSRGPAARDPKNWATPAGALGAYRCQPGPVTNRLIGAFDKLVGRV